MNLAVAFESQEVVLLNFYTELIIRKSDICYNNRTSCTFLTNKKLFIQNINKAARHQSATVSSK